MKRFVSVLALLVAGIVCFAEVPCEVRCRKAVERWNAIVDYGISKGAEGMDASKKFAVYSSSVNSFDEMLKNYNKPHALVFLDEVTRNSFSATVPGYYLPTQSYRLELTFGKKTVSLLWLGREFGEIYYDVIDTEMQCRLDSTVTDGYKGYGIMLSLPEKFTLPAVCVIDSAIEGFVKTLEDAVVWFETEWRKNHPGELLPF